MLSIPLAVFLKFNTLWVILLTLFSCIVTALALCAGKCYECSHYNVPFAGKA
jgi:uncharacterized Tic20 family protein